MADPLTATAIGLQVIGTIGQVAGGISGAKDQERAFKEEARAIQAQTAFERNAAERRNRRIIASNRARAEAGGVVSGSGSPVEVELANAFDAAMNELSIQFAGDLRSRAAKLGARQARGQIPGLIFGGLKQGGSILGGAFLNSGGGAKPKSKPKSTGFPGVIDT